MRATLSILILIILTCLWAGPVMANHEISGTFKITESGKVIGAEKYTIVIDENGQVTTESQGTVRRDETVFKDYSRLVLRSHSGPIHSYQREVLVNQIPRSLAASYAAGELKIEVSEGARRQHKVVQVTPGTIVTDVGIWHHLHLLVHRYSLRVGGEQTFLLVIPSELRVVEKATLTHQGWEAVSLPGGYFMAHRYFFDRGDVGMTIWADKQGQILKIDAPLLDMVIETEKYEGERATEVDPVQNLRGDLTVEEVVLQGYDQVEMRGLITKPKGLPGRLPTLLFLSTSGPQDRDGNSPTANINIGTRRMMDEISKSGFLVLRLDDRGVGQSQGDVAQASLSAQAADAVKAIEFLKQRGDVDPNRIGLFGHGEGANVAIRLAAEQTGLKTVVLLAPCDVPFSDLAIEQIKHRLKLEGVTDPEAWKKQMVATILRRAQEEADTEFIVIGGRGVYLDLYREWFAMQPVENMKKVKAKILHVQGGLDLQVFPHHADGFREAMGNNQSYTFKLFSKLNHFFKPSRGTIAEYSDPSLEVDGNFIKYVITWLKANL